MVKCKQSHVLINQFSIYFRGKVTRMYFFILHLSIADLLTALCTLLPEFVWTFTFPKFYAGNAGCKLMKYLFMVGPYLSSYTLVMTAVDRYQVRAFYVRGCVTRLKRLRNLLSISELEHIFFAVISDVMSFFLKGRNLGAFVLYFSHVQLLVKQIGVGILKGS